MAHERPRSNAILSTSPKSHVISKAVSESGVHQSVSLPRTVRVIQINSPKVVQTDVANFRSIVQRLTGKSRSRALRDQKRTSGSVGEGSHDQKLRLHSQQLHKLSNSLQKGEDPINQGFEYSSSMLSLSDAEEQAGVCTMGDEGLGCPNMCGYSDLDIMAGLISGGPLPDVTMLPPLMDENSQEAMTFLRGAKDLSWRVYSRCPLV